VPDKPLSPKNSISVGAASQSPIGEESQGGSLDTGLYIVATPIGNLRDITLRALDILWSADLIYAEDTRQTRKLLDAYSISASLKPYHDHNAAKMVPTIMQELNAGKSVALVSDAGTPLVSDPGFKLAREAIAEGHIVVPIPGASAVLAGLVSSGLPSDSFTFAGFLPPKSAARQMALERYKTVPGTLIFFETGPRLEDSLKDIVQVLGNRPAAIARELTKRYEETRRGPISELINSIQSDPPRGEIVLIVGASKTDSVWTDVQIDAALVDEIAALGVKRASASIADLSGWAKRDVYARALKLK